MVDVNSKCMDDFYASSTRAGVTANNVVDFRFAECENSWHFVSEFEPRTRGSESGPAMFMSVRSKTRIMDTCHLSSLCALASHFSTSSTWTEHNRTWPSPALSRPRSLGSYPIPRTDQVAARLIHDTLA